MSRMVAFLLLCASLSLSQRIPEKSAPGTKPDVLLVTIDTLRADRVGCYGYSRAKTPTLDRLCRQGIKFQNAFSASPITNTSHASIFTGLYPSRHQVTDFGVPLDTKHQTLAQVLKANGYATAAFIGAVILDSKSLAIGFERGFDHYENFPAKPPSKTRWERVERRADDVVRRANIWLVANQTKPRFIWVHLFDPHDPYEAPEPFLSSMKDKYDGEIAYTDQALGKLLSMLEKQGRLKNTLVIAMADHGEGLGDHGENTHGIFLYDSTVRIPLIIKLPEDARAGSVVSQQVSTVDLLPTIVEHLKLQPVEVDGKSFNSTLTAGTGEDHIVFGETDYPLRFGWAPLKAVRKEGKKYIEAPRPEFYDLIHDATEQRNLYQPWNKEVQSLREQLAEFRKQAPAAAAATAPVDPQTIAELRALGYLGSDPGATTVPEPTILPDPKDKIEIQNLIHTGMMQQDGGDIARARAAFGRAVEADPTSFFALFQLGELEFAAGDYRSATKHLAHAYEQRQDPAVALTLGQALEKIGDYSAARTVLESALKKTPGQYDARVSLGRVYLALKDIAAAKDQFEAAIILNGRKVAARIELAKILMIEGKAHEAQVHLKKAAEAEPKNPEIKKLLDPKQ